MQSIEIPELPKLNLQAEIKGLSELTPGTPAYLSSLAKIEEEFDKLFDSKWYWFNQPIIEANCPLFELGYERGTCPTSENLAGHIINLPCNQSPEVMAKIFEILESKGR